MVPTEQVLIDGKELKHKLEKAIQKCRKNLLFISAYVTRAAVDWLEALVPSDIDVHLICRLLPIDIFNGSTTISALMIALDKGWKVSCLHSLHAKIYSIDNNEIYIGSANLTSNGLRIYGIGNIEACSRVPACQKNLLFISTIEKSATKLDHDILKKMNNVIQDKEHAIHIDNWHQDILSHVEGVWVSDFFWHNPLSSKKQENELIHDLEIIGAESLDMKDRSLAKKVKASRCIQWLIAKLDEQHQKELFFGNISHLLHNELKDDPLPYRTDVKSLVQNLLAYCELFLIETIEISRPNHSQRAKLLMTS